MTKILAALATLLVLGSLALPLAQAHGSTPQREIDQRILADDDGAVSPGFCVEGECAPGQDAGGLDLMSLDIRETHLANGEAAVAFRVAFQSEAETQAGRAVTISFKAGSADTALTFSGDGPGYNSTTCDLFLGPVPIGDGHPQAVDCIVAYSTLGVAVGDKLSAIALRSDVGTARYDIAPGTWYSNGVLVPKAPTEPPADPAELTDSVAPGEYTLVGPATLLKLDAPVVPLAPHHAPETLMLMVTSLLNTTDDFVTLTLNATSGITASLDQASLDLKAKSTKMATLTVDKATADGTVTITLVSALGEYRSILVPVTGSEPDSTVSATPTRTSSGTTESTKKSPAPVGPAIVALAALAFVARRRF